MSLLLNDLDNSPPGSAPTTHTLDNGYHIPPSYATNRCCISRRPTQRNMPGRSELISLTTALIISLYLVQNIPIIFVTTAQAHLHNAQAKHPSVKRDYILATLRPRAYWPGVIIDRAVVEAYNSARRRIARHGIRLQPTYLLHTFPRPICQVAVIPKAR